MFQQNELEQSHKTKKVSTTSKAAVSDKQNPNKSLSRSKSARVSRSGTSSSNNNNESDAEQTSFSSKKMSPRMLREMGVWDLIFNPEVINTIKVSKTSFKLEEFKCYYRQKSSTKLASSQKTEAIHEFGLFVTCSAVLYMYSSVYSLMLPNPLLPWPLFSSVAPAPAALLVLLALCSLGEGEFELALLAL